MLHICKKILAIPLPMSLLAAVKIGTIYEDVLHLLLLLKLHLGFNFLLEPFFPTEFFLLAKRR